MRVMEKAMHVFDLKELIPQKGRWYAGLKKTVQLFDLKELIPRWKHNQSGRGTIQSSKPSARLITEEAIVPSENQYRGNHSE